MKYMLLILICLWMSSCDDQFKMGQEALDIQDFARAKMYFAKFLDSEPNNVEARQGYILSLVGLIEQQDSIPGKSWEEIERELSICSRSLSSPCLLDIQFKLNYQLAKLNYRKSRDLKALKRINQAIELLDQSQLASQKFVFAQHLKASIALEIGNVTQALKLLYQNLELDTDHKGSYILLGSILVEQSEFLEALLILEQAEEKFPNDKSIQYWINEAYIGNDILEGTWD